MAGDGRRAQSGVMKALVLAAASVVAGISLAAFAAPQASCGCAPPPPETLGQATVAALDVLCVTPPGRDVSAGQNFEYWGDFSEFETDDGALEVRPGPLCTIIYLGTETGVREVITAVEQWADGREMEHPAVLRADWGVRYGRGEVEWRILPSSRETTRAVEVTYTPESI